MRKPFCFNWPVILACLAFLFIPPSLYAREADSTMAKRDSTVQAAETCKELIDRVKHSDCAKPLARFLDGASITVGLSLNTGKMDISAGDTLLSTMIGVMSPAPFYGFNLPNRFFGATRFGFATSLTYASSVAVYQELLGTADMVREIDKVRNLGTYASMNFASISPSIFASLGARDATPDKYFRLGFGLGAGWASVRGTAYFTETSTGRGTALCHDAAAAFLDGTGTRQDLRSACELQTYNHFSLGLSFRFFIDARWRFLYYSASGDVVTISSGQYTFSPLQTTVKLAYIKDL